MIQFHWHKSIQSNPAERKRKRSACLLCPKAKVMNGRHTVKCHSKSPPELVGGLAPGAKVGAGKVSGFAGIFPAAGGWDSASSSWKKSSTNKFLYSSTHVQSCSQLPQGPSCSSFTSELPQASPALGLHFAGSSCTCPPPGLPPSPTSAVLGMAEQGRTASLLLGHR